MSIFDYINISSLKPLGSPENWPENLRVAVAAFLESRFPDRKSSREDELSLHPINSTEQADDGCEQLQVQQALQTTAARQSFMLQLLDRLRSIADDRVIMSVASEALARWLGESFVGYCEVEEDEETVFACGEYGDGCASSPVGFRFRQSIGSDFSRILKAGEVLFYENNRTVRRAESEDVAIGESFQLIAGAAIPLLKGGRLVAYLYAVHTEPRF